MKDLPEAWEQAIRNLCEEYASVEDFLDMITCIFNEAYDKGYELGKTAGYVDGFEEGKKDKDIE